MVWLSNSFLDSEVSLINILKMGEGFELSLSSKLVRMLVGGRFGANLLFELSFVLLRQESVG